MAGTGNRHVGCRAQGGEFQQAAGGDLDRCPPQGRRPSLPSAKQARWKQSMCRITVWLVDWLTCVMYRSRRSLLCRFRELCLVDRVCWREYGCVGEVELKDGFLACCLLVLKTKDVWKE